MITEQRFDTGEVVLNLAEGPANGPPLLLLHGSMLTWQTFRAAISLLSERWHVFALDLRGHGKSSRTPGGYRLLDYARDCVAVVQQRIEPPAVVLGHSLGALVAIATAAQASAAVRGLVLVDPPLFYRDTRLVDTKWRPSFASTYAAVAETRTVDEIAARLREQDPQADVAALQRRARRLAQMDPETLSVLLEHRHVEAYDMDRLLRQVVCPTLVIQCDLRRGAALEEDDAEFALQRLRQGRLLVMQDAGHMLHSEAPERLTRALDAWMREALSMPARPTGRPSDR